MGGGGLLAANQANQITVISNRTVPVYATQFHVQMYLVTVLSALCYRVGGVERSIRIK